MAEAPSSESVITSLAVLKANWDYRSQTYTDCFVPFVAEVLRDSSQPSVTLAEIQTSLAARFGFRVPQAALKSILQRAARRGLVRRKAHEYHPDREALAAIDLASARDQVLRKHEALVDKFVTFGKERFGRDLQRDQADSALLAHIERRAVPLLSSIISATPVAVDRAQLTPDQLEYVVGSFVVHLAERDPAGFEYLEAVVKGSMLASVLYLPDIGSAEHRFTDLTVFFDTPFLLEALGYAGLPAQESARELLELVYQLGARLSCFEDTLTEVHGILTAVAATLRNPRRTQTFTGGVGDYFVQQDMRPSDVELLANRIDGDLAARRIEVVSPPSHSKELGVDEVVLRDLLKTQVRYQREDALLHDLDALTAVFRTRKAARFSRIENCEAVFVTTNDSLVAVARRFFAPRQNDASVPIALLDHELATLAWLKKPMAAPELPRKNIIADSLAALQPGPEMWKRYVDEIERLKGRGDVTQDDIVLLRYSCEAHQKLMEDTLGDPSVVSSRTVVDALGAARAAAATAAQLLSAEAQEKDSALDAAQRNLVEANRRADTANATAARVLQAFREDAARKGTRVARLVSRGVFGLLAALGGVGIIVGALPGAAAVLPEWLGSQPARITLGILGAGSTFASVISWTHGTSANSLARSAELWLARRVERRILRSLPINVENESAVAHIPPDPAWTGTSSRTKEGADSST